MDQPTSTSEILPESTSHFSSQPVKPQYNSFLDNIFFRELDPKHAYAIFSMKESDCGFPIQLPVYESDPLAPGIPAYLTLSQARRPQWFYHNQTYLGFVPLPDVFEGPIFGRFHGSRPTFTEQISKQPDGSFIFNPDLADSWIRVEYALTMIARHFYNPLRPLSTPTPPYPSNTKFYEPKPTLKRVLDSVIFAQKLMVFLIAELRHNIALCRKFDRYKTTWDKYLETSSLGPTIDKVWLADLAVSKAMNTAHMAGYLIDPSNWDEAKLQRFRTYSQNYVPLYIILAKIDRSDPFKSKFTATLTQKRFEKIGGFLFTYQEAQKHIESIEFYTQSLYLAREYPKTANPPPQSSTSPYLATPHYTPHSNDALLSPESPAQVTDQGELPESLPNSGHTPRLWWYEYLQDQRSYHHLQLQFADEFDEEEMKMRENYSNFCNSLNELPDNFNTIVYAWKPTPLHPEFLLRTPLETSEARAYWSHYPPTHRIYDPYTRVWDLYDPSCNLNTLTRNLSITTVYSIEPTAEDAGLESLTQEKQTLEIAMPDLLDDRRKTAKMAKARLRKTRDQQFYFEDPVEYAYHHYGLVLPPKSFRFNHETNLKWWLYLGKNLQQENFVEMESVSNALDCLIQGHSEHITQLYDIFLRPKELINDNRVIIQRFPEAIFRSIEGNTVRNLYLLRFPHSKKDDWVIGVNSAANVVLALRENWASHRNNLVRNYLRYGIEFSTLRKLDPRDEGKPISLVVKHRLPLAPATGNFLISDYEKYELERERFFDSPMGRVAGRSGGTVARLWRKNTSRFNERVIDVNKGPSEEALADGVKVYCGPQNLFYDDYLSLSMDSFICGQYLARTAISSGSYPKVSWYKPNHVLNLRRVPYSSRWAEMDEYKFFEAEEKILEGQGPQNVGKWKKESSDKMGILDDPYEEKCVEFLDYYVKQKNI